MLGFELSTSVSNIDILTTRPICPYTMYVSIMPYTMFLDTGKCFMHIEDPLGPFMCMAEHMVTNLQVLQRLRLQEKVPASESISV